MEGRPLSENLYICHRNRKLTYIILCKNDNKTVHFIFGN